MSGARYRSLTPANVAPPSGTVNASKRTTSGAATAHGRRITHTANRENGPASNWAAVFERENRDQLHASTRGPSTASRAGSTVTDSTAASTTALIAPYGTDRNTPCG